MDDKYDSVYIDRPGGPEYVVYAPDQVQEISYTFVDNNCEYSDFWKGLEALKQVRDPRLAERGTVPMYLAVSARIVVRGLDSGLDRGRVGHVGWAFYCHETQELALKHAKDDDVVVRASVSLGTTKHAAKDEPSQTLVELLRAGADSLLLPSGTHVVFDGSQLSGIEEVSRPA
eukprot:m.16439 g.16439  ORF g.16439 m.16439 type:complete len:173 (-) comp3138_c0_seq2:83-601(-)